MTTELNIAQAYFDAWNRRDTAGIVATFAADGTYTDPLASNLSGEAIARYAKGLWEAFPDLAFEIVGTPLVGNGFVAAQWLMKGTNSGPFQGLPPSERSVTLSGADFIQIEGDKIRSVTGYFDSSEVPRQLGLQVLVQPHAVGPFRFGNSVAVQSGKRTRPGAYSITSIQARSQDEAEKITQYSRQIAGEMLKMSGFLGWTGMVIGERLLTVTAWENPESPRQLMREGSHVEAMKAFFGTEIGAAGYTSVWSPERFSPMWVRCAQCGRMSNYEKGNGQCACGQALPEPAPYW